MALCNHLKDIVNGTLYETAFDWTTLIIAIIPPACIPIALLPVLNILTGELFPTDIRNISVGIVKASIYVATYANMTFYPIVSSAGYFRELMLGYGVVSAFMAVWAIINMRKTDNMSLVEIEKSFMRNQADYKSTETGRTQFQEHKINE